MNQELLNRLKGEKRIYQSKREIFDEDLEARRLQVLEMEFRLNLLKKDLLRSEKFLEKMREYDL